MITWLSISEKDEDAYCCGSILSTTIWDHDTEELFHKELRNISSSAVLVLMDDLNFLDLN